MIFTRVSLLLVVTGLFAAMWSADSPVTRTPAQQQLARRATTFQLTGRLRRQSPRPKVQSKPMRAAAVEPEIPLPRGIAPGTYLVVDETGRTCQRIVRQDENTCQNHDPVDHYSLRSERGRWHFIRVSSPGDQVLARPEPVRAAVPR